MIGFKTAAAKTVADAVADDGDIPRRRPGRRFPGPLGQRVQQRTCGHCGRTGDRSSDIRRVLRTGAELLTGKQRSAADRDPNRAIAKSTLTVIIGKLAPTFLQR